MNHLWLVRPTSNGFEIVDHQNRLIERGDSRTDINSLSDMLRRAYCLANDGRNLKVRSLVALLDGTFAMSLRE